MTLGAIWRRARRAKLSAASAYVWVPAAQTICLANSGLYRLPRTAQRSSRGGNPLAAGSTVVVGPLDFYVASLRGDVAPTFAFAFHLLPALRAGRPGRQCGRALFGQGLGNGLLDF